MDSPSVLVGCPVWKREWILPDWFEAIEKSFEHVGLTPEYAFVLDMDDEQTYSCVTAYTDMHERQCYVNHVPEKYNNRDTFKRTWDQDERLEWMAFLRNRLLGVVRKREPDLFLSIDSDILLNPVAFEHMLEAINDEKAKFDAVGGKAFLGRGSRAPLNFGYLNYRNHLERGEMEYLGTVEVLMALKLMKPAAYNIDYKFDHIGEDIGWSIACKEAGLKFGYDGRYCSKHVMYLEDLDVYDPRCGY